MATFATTTSFPSLLIGTELDGSTDDLLVKKIALAENTIKSRLSKRYDVSAFNSITAIPPQLTNICELLTEGLYYIAVSRGNEKAMKRGMFIRKMAMDELSFLIKGDVDLLNTAGSIISEKTDNRWDMTSSSIDYTSTFNEDSATNWSVDSDKLSDISNGRS